MSDLDVKIQDVANFWDFQMPGNAMEELAECIQAINKVERAHHEYAMTLGNDREVEDAAEYQYIKSLNDFKNEVRDVYISLKALMYHYELENDIMERVEKKLDKKYKKED